MIIERGNEVSNTSLTSQRRRVAELEALRAKHQTLSLFVFVGTSKANLIAQAQIDEAQSEAVRQGRELQVTRVKWLL